MMLILILENYLRENNHVYTYIPDETGNITQIFNL